MGFMRLRPAALGLAIALMASLAWAQPPARRATTIAALRNYPGFYHQQTVLVVGDVKGQGDRLTLATESASVTLIAREAPEGRIEARGQFLDIGRLSQDDPRLIPFNLVERVRAAYPDRWPRPGEELMLILANSVAPPASTNISAPPLRNLAMEPNRFEGQHVTILGQFRGRNLFGDLPEAPAPSKWQFVLRASDAGVWVLGLQPRGKGFNFDPTRRIDSGRWLKVAGTVRTAKGLTWLDGTTIELSEAPEQSVTQVDMPAASAIPIDVLFTAPTEGEDDVRPNARIRMQFSRDLDAASLKSGVRITYEGGEQPPVPLEFGTTYSRENRSIEIKPASGWEPFRTVRVVLDGIKGTDGAVLERFTLTFRIGG